MAVIDQAADREYDFWNVQTVPLPPRGGTIVIGWGGHSRLNGWDAGTSASCADAACTPLVQGLIQYGELSAGQINHALFIVVGCSNGRVVYPAAGSGGGGACDDPSNAPASGQWLQLRMSDAEIKRLRAPAWQKAILAAFARYGAMVGDEGSNGAFDFQLASPETYTSLGWPNPYVAWAAKQRQMRGSQVTAYLSEGTMHYVLNVGDGVDWASRLRVIDPCVIAGTC